MPFDYLDNARDWLIIGCYSAQRVSDLLKFEETKIIEDDFLEFTCKKRKPTYCNLYVTKSKTNIE